MARRSCAASRTADGQDRVLRTLRALSQAPRPLRLELDATREGAVAWEVAAEHEIVGRAVGAKDGVGEHFCIAAIGVPGTIVNVSSDTKAGSIAVMSFAEPSACCWKSAPLAIRLKVTSSPVSGPMYNSDNPCSRRRPSSSTGLATRFIGLARRPVDLTFVTHLYRTDCIARSPLGMSIFERAAGAPAQGTRMAPPGGKREHRGAPPRCAARGERGWARESPRSASSERACRAC
jgi:hypothetical protein